MEVIIESKNKILIFKEKKDKTNPNDLNVTNLFNFKKITIDSKSIVNNENWLFNFIKNYIETSNINKIQIDSIELTPLILNILYKINNIEEIIITEKKSIPNNLYYYFIKFKNLKTINCYNMSELLFNELNSKKIIVNTKNNYYLKSNFIIQNDLNTYSKIYYKKEIILNINPTIEDLKDIEFFLKNSKYLKIINLYTYDEQIINELFKIIKNENIKNLNIIIYQENNNDLNINKIIKYINKNKLEIIKKNKIKIKTKYTKNYLEKNSIKQLNYNILKMIIVLIISITLFSISLYEYHIYKAKKKINIINDISTTPIKQEETNEQQSEEIKIEENKKEETIKEIKYEKDFSKLLSINNETVAWLTVNNTTINYPVVKHNDNSYYLNHDFTKSSNINGWIYMDYRNDINKLSKNTIIYGHDSQESIMFGTLKKVLNKSWYQNSNNQIITLSTKDKDLKFEIFSIYTIDKTSDYLTTKFSNQEYIEFIELIKNRSIYNFNKEVSINDNILTLSTCYQTSSKRLVVHAKLIK